MECRVCVIRDLALDRIVMRQGIVTVDKEGDDFADMGLIVKYGNYKMRYKLNDNIKDVKRIGEREMTTVTIINPSAIVCIVSSNEDEITNFIANLSYIRRRKFDGLDLKRRRRLKPVSTKAEISSIREWQDFKPSITLTTIIIRQTPFDSTFRNIRNAINLKTLILDNILPKKREYTFPSSFLACLSRLNSLIHFELRNNALEESDSYRIPAICEKLLAALPKTIIMLCLVNNSFPGIPKTIGRFSRLHELDYSGNLCVTIPSEVAKLKSIVRFKIVSNFPIYFLPAGIFKNSFHISELYVGAIQPMANMLTTMDGELLRSHFKKCKCLDLDNIPAEGLRHPPTLLESCGKVVNERGIEDILPNNLEYWGRSFVECDVCGATIPHSSHRCSIMTGRLGTIATTINGNANAMNTPIAVMLQTCKCCAKASLVKQNIHKLFGEFVYNFGRGEV